jgi:hypothetical protein
MCFYLVMPLIIFLMFTLDFSSPVRNPIYSAYFGDQDVLPTPDWRAQADAYDDTIVPYGLRRLLKFIQAMDRQNFFFDLFYIWNEPKFLTKIDEKYIF